MTEKTNKTAQLKFEDLENQNFTPIEKINLEDEPEKIETEEAEENIFLIEEEEKPEKKETRGRPKKKPEIKHETELLGEEKQDEFIQEEKTLNPSHVTAADLLPTEAVLIAFDKGMSILLPFAINSITGSKFKSHDFKLTTEEKKQLKEPLTACMKELKINISNPFVILGITAFAIYGGKAANVLENGSATPKQDGRGRPRKNG